ncbi:MAG: hypothetical protein FWC42_05750, partial [Proteobacteria bacterium]|nr:hypothetical protein [Pseudomonadota bacterium]
MDANEEATTILMPPPSQQESLESMPGSEPEARQEPAPEAKPAPTQEATPTPESEPAQTDVEMFCARFRSTLVLEQEPEPEQEARPIWVSESEPEQEVRPIWVPEQESGSAWGAEPEQEARPIWVPEPEPEQEARPAWVSEPEQEARPIWMSESEPEQEIRPAWVPEPEQEARPIWMSESEPEPEQEIRPAWVPEQEPEPAWGAEPEEQEPEPYAEPTLSPEPPPEVKSPARLLGEALMARGKLDALALDRAQRLYQDTPNEKFANLLTTLGLVAPIDVAEALAQIYELPLVRADSFPELPILEERVSTRFLREAKVLPLHESEEELTLAMVDPSDTFTVEAFTMATGKRIVPQVALPSEIEAALERLYGAGRSAVGQIVGDIGIETDEFGLNADVQQLKDLASEAPVIRLVSLIIT